MFRQLPNRLLENNSSALAVVLFFFIHSIAIASPAEENVYLNKKIHSLYTAIQDAKKLLAVEKYEKLPTDVYIGFLGNYPSRYGFVVTKVSFQEVSGGKKTSVSRSLTAEFNGPVLSRIKLEITKEDIENYFTTNISLIDATPMDQNYNDWVLKKTIDGLGEPILFSDMKETDPFVLDFKKFFYINQLEEFQILIDLIYSNKQQHPVQNIMKNLESALE